MNSEVDAKVNVNSGSNQAPPKRAPDNFEEGDEDDIDDVDENMDSQGNAKEVRGRHAQASQQE